MRARPGDRFVVISGCSGGGKSTLLAELNRRGHVVIEEPGRRIVAREIERGGSALPWTDLAAFAREAIKLSLADREAARDLPGLIFFDRSLVDAAAALQHATGEPHLAGLRGKHLYHPRVFLAPPWPEIYRTDGERRHSLEEAIAEHERLRAAYAWLGYELAVLPKASVEQRADFILDELQSR
ncbi:AAA family ATPase [Sphingosinicella terrae]|uniref:AAA family ATPase n=1 Tax=Sphingosinicella terrae TaxID=2172047 RepID=UPI000E0CFECD|nr:AAA family ATPase [Sphingosinicella terrae]